MAYEENGELALQQMLHNHFMWQRADTRQALHDVAWAVVKNDKHADLMAANLFNGVREDFAKKHPDWFKDEDDKSSSPPGGPLTEADIEQLAPTEEWAGGKEVTTFSPTGEPVTKADIDSLESRLSEILQSLNIRLGTVWWFSLGTLVGVGLSFVYR
ncbi:hypothetical protein [Marinobacterium aestuariivivens]|uniref:Uncharacterized protein n=1 Tax=Marinobacterium aestuariivivens TaxID=1698799 RepID=A0ABW2AAB1_9GAMM